MASVLPFDELNKVNASILERFGAAKLTKTDDYEDIIDELLDLFLLAYARATEVTNDNLSSNWKPTVDDVMRVVDERVAGKTWRERVEDYFANGGSAEDIVRIVETESHRIANTAALDTAKRAERGRRLGSLWQMKRSEIPTPILKWKQLESTRTSTPTMATTHLLRACSRWQRTM